MTQQTVERRMGGSIMEALEVPETAFDWPETPSSARSLIALKYRWVWVL
jgi:hypothetical protein